MMLADIWKHENFPFMICLFGPQDEAEVTQLVKL